MLDASAGFNFPLLSLTYVNSGGHHKSGLELLRHVSGGEQAKKLVANTARTNRVNDDDNDKKER